MVSHVDMNCVGLIQYLSTSLLMAYKESSKVTVPSVTSTQDVIAPAFYWPKCYCILDIHPVLKNNAAIAGARAVGWM